MRRILLVLGIGLLLVGPAWAEGQFTLFGTYGEMTEKARGIGAGARLGWAWKSVALDLTGTWLPQKSTDVITEGGAQVTDDLRITPLELGVRFMLSPGPEFRPFVSAGLSYFLVDAGGGSTDDEAGYYVSAGFLYGPGQRSKILGEVIYRDATTTVDYPDHGGREIDIGGFAVSAGIMFVF
jgi:hypothetical protein